MNPKPNVLQLIDSLAVGGAEAMAVNIANALNAKNIVSHLVTSRKEGPLKNRLKAEVGYLFLNRKNLIDISAFFKLYRYIKLNKINIIHAHATSWFLAVVMKIMNPSVKIIWHDHFGFREQLQKRTNISIKIGSVFFNSVIAVNQILLNWAKQHLYAKHCYFLPNFIENNQIVNKNGVVLNGLANKRIICLANLRWQKDHLNLLNAFKIVHQEFPEWTLHLIGNKLDLKYYQEIEAFINQHQLQHKVWIYENQAAIFPLLSQAEIGVLSSKSEGLPLALLEYGMAKLGVVATNVGDCASVLDQGKNGCVVPASNSDELAQKMIFLIKNKEARKKMGENLYQKVQTTYSEEAVSQQLIKIYQKLE